MISTEFVINLILALGWKYLDIISDSPNFSFEFLKSAATKNLLIQSSTQYNYTSDICGVETYIPSMFVLSSFGYQNKIDCILKRKPYLTLVILDSMVAL